MAGNSEAAARKAGLKMGKGTEVQVLDADVGPELSIVEGEGRAHAVIWPGMGAEMRSMQRISLGAGATMKELRHPGEAVYYVIEGSGQTEDPATSERQPLVEGSMVHVEADTAYVLGAGEDGMELVGGPSPPDPALYEKVAG